MKFAIRKLAITCVLPTALWQGPMMSDAWAQNFPTASSKITAGMPQRRAVSTKKAPPAQQQAPAANANNQLQYPAANRAPQGPAAPISQVANPGAQLPPGSEALESDVQKQLRLLYEKSGQEMPAMDLNELEVPEPQPGVAPGSSPNDSEDGPQSPQHSSPQYAQPAVPPQKAPNFFERVFLGKKAPPPRPAPQQRPQLPPPVQYRPAQPAAAQPGTPPANNYRPYQPGQPVQQGQPAQRLPQAMNGQRPNVVNQPAAVAQPNAVPQQQVPQLQLQRPGQPQVIPAPLPSTQRPAAPAQIQNPPAFNPQGTAGQTQQAPAGRDEVPFLDEEPEESMEFDLSSKPQPKAPAAAAPTDKSANVAPAQVPTSNSLPNPEQTKSAAEPTAPPEENPFSGLRLSIPETAVPAVAAPSSPSPEAARTPATSPAADAILAPDATPPRAAAIEKEPDPFLDDEEAVDREIANPKELPAVKANAPAAIKAAELPPVQVPEKKVLPPAKPTATVAAKPAPRSSGDERLKKLAEAREKTGLKGFCPVALRQKGELIETKLQFNTTYQGKKYNFSSAAAKAAFEKEPQLFAPVHDGQDGVALIDDEKSLPGSLDYALWYQGRLYLFASRENRDTFVNDPEGYLDEIELEQTLNKAVSNAPKSAQPVPQQKAPAAAPADMAVKPQSKQPSKPAALPDDLPVLSDNLDEVPLLTPVTSSTPEAATIKPAARTPALAPIDGEKAGSSTRDAAAPVTPKPEVKPANSPAAINPGPQLELPLLKKASKNTPASFTVPVNQSSNRRGEPRLINPDLRLAPAVRQ